ncbi:hypothetical protein [Sphingosinithalassobacter portus]|uniref:hypothetical protein n=1 Tax=Stakelama portus TaxID=2676234 RepID=UPI000D6E824C|nr:hypothetical protein [Sphingosinithalassobacter portus]
MLTAMIAIGLAGTPPCDFPEQWAYWLRIPEMPARPGATLRLEPEAGVSYNWVSVPTDCIKRWEVSDPAMADVDPETRQLHIHDDAVPGTRITISYTNLQDRRSSASVLIVGAEEKVLTGARRQSGLENCAAGRSIGEMVFRDDGSFSVTYQPFESYQDYWGRYIYDPVTGALAMTVTGGNLIPEPLDLWGSAYFNADGKLVLDGVFLGAAPPPQPDSCRYIFG